MTRAYRVFLGAPLAKRNYTDLPTVWQTVTSAGLSPPLPTTTLEHAERRLSLVYENFALDETEPEDEPEDNSEEWGSIDGDDLSGTQSREITTITRDLTTNLSNFQETCDTVETTMLSEGSSISRFPTFNFNTNSLSSLSSVMQSNKSGKMTFLLGVLEVDGPNLIKVKTGPYTGSEVTFLKLIVGDEQGAICKLTAWRETAEIWSGAETEPALKRGDIVLFGNVTINVPRDARDSHPKTQFTASPNLKSQAQICYRTLPASYEDRKLRPDLRLGDSVAAVRKVGEVVKWMERMAGITSDH